MSIKNAPPLPTLIRRYCLLIKEADSTPTEAFLTQLNWLIPTLYAELSQIKKNETKSIKRKPTGWQKTNKRLAKKLKQHNFFYEVFNCLTKEEPVSFSISMALTEIYEDLSEALAVWDRGGAKNHRAASNLWRTSFQTHTSYHLAGVIRPLQALVVNLSST